MEDHEDSHFLRKEPCPKCGSKDNLARYTDGHAYCFGCFYREPRGEGLNDTQRHSAPTFVNEDLLPLGEFVSWESRGITQATAEKWKFSRSSKNGEAVRIHNYCNDAGVPVAQKVRFKGKDFRFYGETKNPGLFGKHLWRDSGKKIVIVEGELDAMSLSQMQDHKWPVVSVVKGAQAAATDIKKDIDWLEKFEEVVLMFDMDEPGRSAAQECAILFTPGKCKIASLPLKDANEMLMEGRIKETIDCIWAAKVYRPDGILGISDIIDDVLKPVTVGLGWFMDELTKATYGRRYGEIYGFGAGTGCGKTDVLMEQIAYDITQLGMPVGAIFLEQKPAETAKRVAGKVAGKRFHIPDAEWENDDLKRSVGELENKLYFYDSWGQADWDVVKGHIRYMAVSLGIKLIYLDHLTALADTSDERGSLEKIMKEMASLANELNIIIHFVSHLATPEGKPHEEGGRVMIRHFKGARAIGFWSFFMFGIERDQQNEDEDIRTTTIFRVLKDRYTGNSTGTVILLKFERETGRLVVRSDDPFNPQEEQFNDGSNAAGAEDF